MSNWEIQDYIQVRNKVGRIVLPKKARERLGITSGAVLKMTATQEGIHLRKT